MNEIRPVLAQVNIVVRDLSATVELFRTLGVEIADTIDEWMPHHRMMESAPGGLAVDLDSDVFARHWDRGLPEGWTGVVPSFRAPTRDDVDTLYDRALSAGCVGQQPPYDAFWGARFAVVQSPDGVIIGLTSEPEDDRREAPPDPSTFAG